MKSWSNRVDPIEEIKLVDPVADLSWISSNPGDRVRVRITFDRVDGRRAKTDE